MLNPRRRRTRPVDRLQVSRHVKLGTLARLARETGLTESELVAEARRQYRAELAAPLALHLQANLEGIIAELDAWRGD